MCLLSCWYITKVWDETEDHSQNWEFLTKAILQQSPIPWFDHSKKESSEIWVLLINVPSYLHHQHQAPRCTRRGYLQLFSRADSTTKQRCQKSELGVKQVCNWPVPNCLKPW
jgi:hypothetical protein